MLSLERYNPLQGWLAKAEGFASPQNLYDRFQSPEITRHFPDKCSRSLINVMRKTDIANDFQYDLGNRRSFQLSERVSVRKNGSHQISRISDLLPDLQTPFPLITKISLVTYDALEANYRRNVGIR
ncbi:hypothetical protein FOWG_13421 [Fusarium oxysporum f. sp. lycopersici MN25]|nr:hypothetical protein FOWG_13421 [Fusarium oxysporum f. sp. lycopersici MN25]